ncbi:MAG TPA: putative metal-dependent hydrolase, partial [Bryobacteraceae bacterium]|nr:putative metal-dependent hydrolase [Bryobacteraceae bacterium]
MMSPLTDPRYPIGPFRAPAAIARQDLQTATDAIAALPLELRRAVQGWTDAQLDTPYRSAGWTVRQLVHHMADSHMNAYIRVRKALTENKPEISVYDEKAWAELTDARHAEVNLSLDLLDCLHRRWVSLLRSLGDDDWNRSFLHPERGEVRLDVNTLMYAWHGKHHLA